MRKLIYELGERNGPGVTQLSFSADGTLLYAACRPRMHTAPNWDLEFCLTSGV